VLAKREERDACSLGGRLGIALRERTRICEKDSPFKPGTKGGRRPRLKTDRKKNGGAVEIATRFKGRELKWEILFTGVRERRSKRLSSVKNEKLQKKHQPMRD